MNIHAKPIFGRMLINGDLVESESGDLLDSVNPATEESIGYVPAATAADVDRAVVAAEKAHPAWAALEPKERAKLMRKVAQKLRENTDNILRTEVVDTGNTITKMRADVATAGDTLDFYAGFATEIKGETIPASGQNLHFTHPRTLWRGRPYRAVQSPDQICRQRTSRTVDGRQLRGAQAPGD